MNLHFLILAHHLPSRFASLCKALLESNSTVTAHIDFKSDLTDFTNFKFNKDVKFLTGKDRIPVNWGGWSQVQATLNLLKVACKNASTNDYFVLLSGDSFPLISPNFMIKFFQRNSKKQFITGAKMPTPTKPITRLSLKYFENYQYGNIFSELISFLNNHPIPNNYLNKMNGLIPFAGSQWFALNGEAVNYLFQKIKEEPNLIKLAKYSRCPDEYFIQTLIFNSYLRGDTEPSIVAQRWSNELNSGVEFNSENIYKLLKTNFLSNHDEVHLETKYQIGYALFGRKVISPAIEDEIISVLWPHSEKVFT